jgi:hypothetical protein
VVAAAVTLQRVQLRRRRERLVAVSPMDPEPDLQETSCPALPCGA